MIAKVDLKNHSHHFSKLCMNITQTLARIEFHCKNTAMVCIEHSSRACSFTVKTQVDLNNQFPMACIECIATVFLDLNTHITSLWRV